MKADYRYGNCYRISAKETYFLPPISGRNSNKLTFSQTQRTNTEPVSLFSTEGLSSLTEYTFINSLCYSL